MSRITINTLSSVETLNRAAMAETNGGLLFPLPFPRRRPRVRCFFVRSPFFPFRRRRICVPVLPLPLPFPF